MDDLVGIGDRIVTFSSVLKAIISLPSLGRRTPFQDLFNKQFGWFRLSNSTYLPWASQSSSQEIGIVICVPQHDSVMAAFLIQTLRKCLHSYLPTEIAYAGDEDLPEASRNMLTNLASGPVHTLDLLHYFDESIVGLARGRHAIKPFAALASRFQRTILVDADVMFLSRPDHCFSQYPGLRETGILYFHDRAFGAMREWIEKRLMGRLLSTTNPPSGKRSSSISRNPALYSSMKQYHPLS